jgi:hypothetical protein
MAAEEAETVEDGTLVGVGAGKKEEEEGQAKATGF